MSKTKVTSEARSTLLGQVVLKTRVTQSDDEHELARDAHAAMVHATRESLALGRAVSVVVTLEEASS